MSYRFADSEKLLMMDRVKCPKHVEFYSKNKFEKLVQLVGFIIRIYHDARSPERKIFTEGFKTGLTHIIQVTADL
jgi:hypothetical protein